MDRLQDKIAAITGAASGIGREAAVLFAREGARLVLSDVDADGLAETAAMVSEAGAQAATVVGDLADEAAAARLVQEAASRFGALHVLYNNAAIGYSNPITHGSVLDISPDNWDAVVRNNLRSVYLCCKAAIPAIIESGGGSIVNTSSTMGFGSNPGADAYAAAKGGVIALSRALAAQFGPDGVRVNVICPGSIATPMIQHLLDDEGARQRMAQVPLRRIGKPIDVAYAALYFASDESTYTTGAVLVVDGGRMI